MVTLKPFAALLPKPELAPKICELPYDVMSSDEAREMAAGNPLSFLHVSKPEIDLSRGTAVDAPEVYAKGLENFQKLIAQSADFDAAFTALIAKSREAKSNVDGVVSEVNHPAVSVVEPHSILRGRQGVKFNDRLVVLHEQMLDDQLSPVGQNLAKLRESTRHEC